MKGISRREFLKRTLALGLGIIFSGLIDLGKWLRMRKGFSQPLRSQPDLAVIEGLSPREMVLKAIEKLGGIDKFVSTGDVVAIKPNIAWARTPEYAANTNPLVLKAIIEACIGAGAKKVQIVDNPCDDPKESFSLSGAEEIAEETGAQLIYPKKGDFKRTDIRGEKVKMWPVNTHFLEADVKINIPVAKHHSLARLTLGMKNWIGGIGGMRWLLHQHIHQSIADLANFFRPQLTIIDATRILVAHGPSGGDLADVRKTNTIIAGVDPVACDSYAAKLFDLTGRDLGYCLKAYQMGLGEIDYRKMDIDIEVLS